MFVYSVAPRSELGPLNERLGGGVVDVFEELADIQNRMLCDFAGRYDGVTVTVTRRQHKIWSATVDAETLLEVDWTGSRAISSNRSSLPSDQRYLIELRPDASARNEV